MCMDLSTKNKELISQFNIDNSQSWLSGRNYSEKFVICIGAGPWKFARRKLIQERSLAKLQGRDLANLAPAIDWFPLDWQNQFCNNLIFYLHDKQLLMRQFCESVKTREEVYQACGKPVGTKCLSLFCRDGLNLPAFPIDRHVKRFLKDNNLPTDEYQMIKICNELGFNPNVIARNVVQNFGEVENPDWSV